VNAVFGQDLRQKAQPALSSHTVEEVEILPDGKEGVEPTDLLNDRSPQHGGREHDCTIRLQEVGVLALSRLPLSDNRSVAVNEPELGVTQTDALVLHRLHLRQQSTGKHAVVVIEEGDEVRTGVPDTDVTRNGLAAVSLPDHPHAPSFSMSEKSSSHPSATTIASQSSSVCACSEPIASLR
jgi:hypothetical protein